MADHEGPIVAIQDCIKKIGKAISPEDRALLEQYLDEGLSDEQAVRRLLVETTANVVSIATQARAAGAEVATPENVVAEIQNLSDEKMKRLFERREELTDQIDEINAEYRELASDSEVFDGVVRTRTGAAQSLEEMSEARGAFDANAAPAARAI